MGTETLADRMAAQDRAAMAHYDDLTGWFYAIWHPEHIHFGLFEPGEYPEDGSPFTGGPEALTPGLERMIEAVIAPAGIGEGHHVVDAGCGLGGTARYLARTRGARVTGINVSRAQIEAGEKKNAEQGMEHLVDFRFGDCSEELPLPSNSVDFVVNLESACHYGDRGRFLREVARILKPGGGILAFDWLVNGNTSDEDYDRYMRPLCENWCTSPRLETLGSYRKLLTAAGLTPHEAAGFDGREVGNLRLLESFLLHLRALHFCGLMPARMWPRIPLFTTIVRAWQLGHFELERYHATKPLDA